MRITLLTLRFYSLLLVLSLSGIFVQAGTAPTPIPGNFRPLAGPVIGTTTFSGLFPGTTSLGSGGTSTLTAANVGGSGWDFTVTGTSTLLAILVPNGGGADDGSTSDFCIRTSVNAAVPDGQTIIKSNDGSAFSLKSVFFRVNIMGSGSADITITGFRSGSPVPGATKTMTMTGSPTTAWTKFDVSAISAFGNVDQFSFKQAATTNLNITFMVTDDIALAAPVPLPLTLLNFSGRLTDKTAQLQWTTASEQNTSHFEIQRGNNGADFSTIGSVQAAGSSTQTLHYDYTDTQIPTGSTAWFYRLRLVDIDEHFTYSSVLKINTAATGPAISAYPNPFRQELTVTIISAEAGKGQLMITDMGGKILLRQTLSLQPGSNSYSPPAMTRLSKGVYLLNLATPQQQRQLQVLKIE